jgi:hypothetical protein
MGTCRAPNLAIQTDTGFDTVSGGLAGPAFTKQMLHREKFKHDKENDAFGLVVGSFRGRQIVNMALRPMRGARSGMSRIGGLSRRGTATDSQTRDDANIVRHYLPAGGSRGPGVPT